jgi:2-polyprenyl-3-methyl-5-hydroxy-6-metoxy-1,4-benzoquinol methylase
LKQHYDDYWNRSNPPPLGDPLAVTRASILWQLVERDRIAPKTFLDVGCGEGYLVAEAGQRGMSAIGIDIAEGAVNLARQRYPEHRFVERPVEERPWPIEAGTIDLVASFEVIEHLMRPEELVIGMAETLRSGGHAAITTPYHGLVKNVAIALFGFDKHYAVTGDHIRFFSDRALRDIVERHGLRVKKLVHFGRVRSLWAGVLVWAYKP